MDKEKTFNWKIRFATMTIFLLGFVAGALALNAYQAWFSTANSPTKKQRFEKIFDQISLNEIQKEEVQKIMGETREEFKNLPPSPEVENIRNRADEKIKKVFTPEQWENFQRLREEFREAEKIKK